MKSQPRSAPNEGSDAASRAKGHGPSRSHMPSVRANNAARLYFAEGKSFREAMLRSGYSPSIAAQGPKYNLRRNVSLRRAFEAASHINLRPEQLKMLAVHRLASEIASPKHTDGVKPIEVLGRMREFDWFIKNNDAQVGILIDLSADSVPADNPLDSYHER